MQEILTHFYAYCTFHFHSVYIHVLRMVAMAIDTDYQSEIANLAKEYNGEHRAAELKGVARMWNKLMARNDHRYLPAYLERQGWTKRSGQNLDIIRNAVTFQTVGEMTSFIKAVEMKFDGAARVKNMFAFSNDRAGEQLHYRTYMVNTIWPPPTGHYPRTFHDLLGTAKPLWDAYENTVPQDRTFSPHRFQMHIQQARQHLERLAADQVPLRFICESQILLQQYLDGRKAMHLLYKVIRSENDKALHNDFCSAESVKDAGKDQKVAQIDAVKEMKSKDAPIKQVGHFNGHPPLTHPLNHYPVFIGGPEKRMLPGAPQSCGIPPWR